jgi:hypothetical protein
MPTRRGLPLEAWLLLGSVLGLASIWHGLYLLKGGAIDPESLEHTRSLGWVNIINSALGKPAQDRLRDSQLRAFGWLYTVFGVLAIILPAAALVIRVLQSL